MKNTVLFIDSEAKRQGLTMAEMANRMGIDKGVFPKYRNGSRSSVNPETLIKMQHGISDDPSIQAKLLAAYLEDQCVGPASGRIAIQTIGSAEEEAGAFKVIDIHDRLAQQTREEGLDWGTVNDLISLVRGLRKNRTLKRVLKALASRD